MPAPRTAASVTTVEVYKIARWLARRMHFGPETDRDDLIHEGVVAVLRSLNDFRPGAGCNVISWAVKYAHNAMLTYLAKTQRPHPDPHQLPPGPIQDPSDVFDDTVLWKRLSPLAQLAMTETLRSSRKLNYDEMGEHLGIPSKAVKGIYAELRSEMSRVLL